MLSPTGSLLVRGSDPVARSGGAFGASRIRKGKPYGHRGVDLEVQPWIPLKAPDDCTISRIGIAYANDLRFHSIMLTTPTDIIVYEIKILYAWPFYLAGTELKRGQLFAMSENLGFRYTAVTNHIHIQVRRHGDPRWINPMPFLEAT